jgi:hypothetical protein
MYGGALETVSASRLNLHLGGDKTGSKRIFLSNGYSFVFRVWETRRKECVFGELRSSRLLRSE